MRLSRLMTCALAFGMAGAATAEPAAFFQNMAGCFSVTYNFVEDGGTDAFFPPVLERAELSQSEDVLHIRRTLIVEGQSQPHWREEWRLKNAGENIWEQSVFGPFEDFRYRCSGKLEGDAWRCDAPASPKPRRDAARPYKTLDRENTLKVNDKRWVHMQKNIKRMADGSFYALELGWNQYERTEASSCTVD